MKRINELLKGLAMVAGFAAVVVAAPAFAQAATLSLSPTSGTHAVGDSFEVKINLDTSGVATSGTDAYVRFDPNVLTVVDSQAGTDGTQIQAGTLYSQTSFNSVDNSTGKVSFSGSKTGGSPGYTGSGTLATITFQAVKEASSTSVSFDFTQNSTTDSNVISNADSTDALTNVTNASYAITAAAGTTDPSNGGSTTPGTDGTSPGGSNNGGGSDNVATTGMDLSSYLALTVLSLVVGIYLVMPKRRRS